MNKFYLFLIIFLTQINLSAQEGKAAAIDIKLNADKLNNFVYNIELFPNQVFTGYWYFWANEDTLQADFQPTSQVGWVNMNPQSFTSVSCQDIVPVSFTFEAPALPGTYNVVFTDLNGNWDQMNITLTVTDNPAAALLDSVTSTINETAERTEIINAEGLTGFGCIGLYFPGSTADVSYSASDNADWLTFNPQTFTLSAGNPSVEVTKTFLSDSAGEFTTYEIRSFQWLARPRFIKWIFNVREFEIVRPSLNELWISGEKDTIRWNAYQDTINISFSTDYENGAGNFQNIVENYPADSGFYVWDIPDGILSTECAISIEKSSDPNNFEVSDAFKIKGYELTRIKPDGNYEAFNPAIHGWSFGNTQSSIWPQSWYQQFDYSGIDPFTSQKYPLIFLLPPYAASSQNFVDWPLYVKSSGTDICYFDTVNGEYDLLSVWKWKLLKSDGWGGSCHGFAVSAYLAFNYKDQFISKFNLPQFQNLFSLSLNDQNRLAINELWFYGSGIEQRNFRIDSWNKTPVETLEEIREMFLNDNQNIQPLYLADFDAGAASGAHSVNPYKIIKDSLNPNLEYIYVYDNNAPGFTNRRITINKSANSWDYQILNGWTGTKYLLLELPVERYLINPLFKSQDKHLPKEDGLVNKLEFYNSTANQIKFIDTSGNTAGFDSSGFHSAIPGVIPFAPPLGYPAPPKGYFLNEGDYSIEMSNYMNTESYIGLVSDSLVMAFGRSDAELNQKDIISFRDNGIGIVNPDAQTKLSNFNIVTSIDNSEQRAVNVINCQTLQNDSVFFSLMNQSDTKLFNKGSLKNYELAIIRSANNGSNIFYSSQISHAENSTHIFIPDWTDFNNPVKLYIDNGNDGSIDDSMFIDNTVDTDNRDLTAVPEEYNLAQNYPNPFNPSTKIEFTLPAESTVKISVFNILGEKVRELVNDQMSAGIHYVNFNAGNLASGIYIYQIEAKASVGTERFTAVKKMIVLK